MSTGGCEGLQDAPREVRKIRRILSLLSLVQIADSTFNMPNTLSAIRNEHFTLIMIEPSSAEVVLGAGDIRHLQGTFGRWLMILRLH